MPRAYYLRPPVQLESPRPDLLLEAVSLDPQGNALSLWPWSHSVVIASHTPGTTELVSVHGRDWYRVGLPELS